MCLALTSFMQYKSRENWNLKKALGDFASRSKQNKVYSDGWGKQVGEPLTLSGGVCGKESLRSNSQ